MLEEEIWGKMKLVILGAGLGKESLENEFSIPKSLLPLSEGHLVLDEIIHTANSIGISEIIYVGGRNIVEVMGKYPELKYYYAVDSEESGNLHSFCSAVASFNDDLLIIYSDIIFKSSIYTSLLNIRSNIGVAFDSDWQNRYEGRAQSYLDEAEKIYTLDSGKLKFTKKTTELELIGEFAGIVYIKKEILKDINEISKIILSNDQKASILNLLNYYTICNHIDLFDIKGKWAELDSSQDVNTFQFGTKANTLDSLRKKLQKSIVLEQFSFTVKDWQNNKDSILMQLKSKFEDKNSLVIRSSAINEDTANASMAGNFESVLDVDINDIKAIKNAVTSVISSYEKKESGLCLENQILTQPFLKDVDISGVAFTRDIETKAPYFTINFDDSTRTTDSVTSGQGTNLKTYVINKFNVCTDINWLNSLIDALKEIEDITKDDFIDVEFAIKGTAIYVLQVRPIAAHKNEVRVTDDDFLKTISSIKKYVLLKNEQKQYGLAGRKTAYGIMPDWNPAEIIGVSPKPLALSLYKVLITDNVWPKSRSYIGYRDIQNNYGLISFAGRPYVDIRASFNTFTPAQIPNILAERLIDYYLNCLEKRKHLHDKVEFEVVLNTYTFDVDNIKSFLLDGGFTEEECSIVIKSLQHLTKDVIENHESNITNLMNDLLSMEEKLTLILKSDLSEVEKIYNLVNDCKELGTFQFSVLARYAFMASVLMKSLVKLKVLSEDRLNMFLESLSTIPKMLISDLGKKSHSDLIEKYGHLRPGTYDIESLSYEENPHVLKPSLSSKLLIKEVPFQWLDDEKESINKYLEKSNFEISFEGFINFIKSSIESREFAKFLFTKNLSKILDYSVKFGEKYSVSRSDMSYLTINDIIRYYGENISFNIASEISEIVKYNKKQFLISHSLKLPPLIFSEKDIDFHLYKSEKPNFISNIKCAAKVIILKGDETNGDELNDKIVVIEKADPGFDWIFSNDIKGLITQYGGVASHMAIRCAELGLPAAIGCGELIFNYVKKSTVIELDCSTRQIIRVQ